MVFQLRVNNYRTLRRHCPTTTISSQPFIPIISRLACIKKPTKQVPVRQRMYFLVSDPQATGLVMLVWVVEEEPSQRRRQQSLFSENGFVPIPKRLCFFRTIWHSSSQNPRKVDARRMEPISETILCLDAQPIQATPLLIPKRCGVSKRFSTATEVLVLQLDGHLMLHRAQKPLTPLTVEGEAQSVGRIVALTDPLCHRIGVVIAPDNDSRDIYSCRVSVELCLPCQFAEQALSAIQSSLEKEERRNQSATMNDGEEGMGYVATGALLFRADCIRAFQKLARQTPELQNMPYKALRAVVMAVVQWDLPASSLVPRDRAAPKMQVEHQSSAWPTLLASEYGLEHDLFPSKSLSDVVEEPHQQHSWLREVYIDSGPQFLRHLQKLRGQRNVHSGGVTPLLFDPLHLLLEDTKLSNSHGTPPDLVDLLVGICGATAQPSDLQQAFLRHYQHSTASPVHFLSASAGKGDSFTTFKEPPSILAWTESVLGNKQSSSSYFDMISPKHMNPACSNLRFVLGTFPLLCQGGDANRVVQLLIEEGFRDQLSICESFVPGIAFPLLSFLYKLTNDASEEPLSHTNELSPEGFALIGRNDLSFNMIGRVATSKSILFPSGGAVTTGGLEGEDGPSGGATNADEERDGLVPLEVLSSMLFPDNRIREAARLLRSSRPMFLRVPRIVEITDHEYEQLKQKKLSLLVRRALGLPVGRGMMTIGSLKPLAAESLPLPELCLKGRVPPTNGTLSLDQSECPPELKVWPEFHNGVAAGLRLPLRDGSVPQDPGSQITRTWILHNKPPRSEMPNVSEDGSNNNSNNAAVAEIHGHGGFLLALGLRGHLTALEMTDIYEYLTRGTVTLTVGVLLGMAANKRGSCDMSVSKMLCLHIPSLIPQHFSAIDVASAVQAAAVAGVGLLYQRSSHRMMTEFLLNEIGKRPESDTSAFDREAYTVSCGIALGMVNLCIGGRSGHLDRAAGISDLRVEERLRRFINGGQSNEEEARRIRESNDRFSIPSSSNGLENEKCSIIFEANMINTDVTAPAATLAIGLMYMKSGNYTVASAVSIPQTHFLLEYVRPDFLGLRVVARSLILWDEVEPTKSWIERQVPSVVQSAYFSMRSIARKAMEGRTPVKGQRNFDYDRRAVRQIYANIIAGACFSIGLRYAGTGDERAKKSLFDCVLQMHKLREGNDPVSVVSKPESPILETCLGLCALSLAMVLAGTGDLDALRLFKTLRWRMDKDTMYGTHMVFGAATGLLFLGGGTMTLGRDAEDIAALVAAFFPRFPTESMDNQYHLQALRHLYALAARKSDIWAIDVDNGERVYVPIETLVNTSDPSTCRMQVPCLLRNSDTPTRFVKVMSDEFYPLVLQLHTLGTNVFCVKRRRLTEPKIGDITTIDVRHGGKTELNLLSQLEYYSISPVDGPILRKLISEQQTKERYGIVLLFLSLMNGLRNMDQHSSATSSPALIELMWNLRLLRSFHERYVPQQSYGEHSWPLEADLLAFLLEKAYQQLVLLTPGLHENMKQLLASVLYSK